MPACRASHIEDLVPASLETLYQAQDCLPMDFFTKKQVNYLFVQASTVGFLPHIAKSNSNRWTLNSKSDNIILLYLLTNSLNYFQSCSKHPLC